MKLRYSLWICAKRIDKLRNKSLLEKKKKEKKFSSDSSTEQDFCCLLMYSDIGGRQRHHTESWADLNSHDCITTGLDLENTFTAYAHSRYVTPHAVTRRVELAPPGQPVTPAGQEAALLTWLSCRELKSWVVSAAGFIVLLTPAQRRSCSCVSKSLQTSSEINRTVSQTKLFSRSSWNGAYCQT